MNSQAVNTGVGLIAAIVLGGCAGEPTYSPPPEGHMANHCAVNEVWVCNDHSPSRLKTVDKLPQVCRCERPERIR